ncbi:hypothetical protein HPP92_016844 [Vanilla planifolia]|uniref:Uncharacterized protein n=1 Tax=Vanilla planifolia TaxID=51239 RepID=A0A835USG4_VANPL|nr:hypothetical protein HPP92_016844 [Vanilla planifolia]
MPFWGSHSGNEDTVDDFDDYDPTPYSGGYDQVLTYGRPLPPSDEICYSLSTPGEIDYNRPNYNSGSQASIYEAEADFGNRYGRPRPKPQPQSETKFVHGGDGSTGGDYGSGYGRRPEYGSGYGRGSPKRDEEDEGYVKKPQYGSEYGRQKETQRVGEERYGGSGYRRNDEEGYGGGEFRKNDEEGYGKQTYGGEGYGRQSYREDEYRGNQQEGYGHQGYQREGDEYRGVGDGYKRTEEFDYGVKTSYGGQRYGGDEEKSGTYRQGRYGEEEGRGNYKKSSYGDEEEAGGIKNQSTAARRTAADIGNQATSVVRRETETGGAPNTALTLMMMRRTSTAMRSITTATAMMIEPIHACTQ